MFLTLKESEMLQVKREWKHDTDHIKETVKEHLTVALKGQSVHPTEGESDKMPPNRGMKHI